MKSLLRGRTARVAVVLAAVAALAVSAAAATAAPRAHAAKKADSLVIGYPGIPPIFMATRLYVADKRGYYKKYGANVELKGFTTGTDAVRAVRWVRLRRSCRHSPCGSCAREKNGCALKASLKGTSSARAAPALSRFRRMAGSSPLAVSV